MTTTSPIIRRPNAAFTAHGRTLAAQCADRAVISIYAMCHRLASLVVVVAATILTLRRRSAHFKIASRRLQGFPAVLSSFPVALSQFTVRTRSRCSPWQSVQRAERGSAVGGNFSREPRDHVGRGRVVRCVAVDAKTLDLLARIHHFGRSRVVFVVAVRKRLPVAVRAADVSHPRATRRDSPADSCHDRRSTRSCRPAAPASFLPADCFVSGRPPAEAHLPRSSTAVDRWPVRPRPPGEPAGGRPENRQSAARRIPR